MMICLVKDFKLLAIERSVITSSLVRNFAQVDCKCWLKCIREK